MIENATALIAQTPAARPSMPSEKLTTFITKTRPTIVSGAPAPPRSTAPRNGSVKFVTSTPAETGIAAATICPASLTARDQLEAVVDRADESDQRAAREDAPHAVADLAVEVQEQRARDEHPGEDREAAEQRRLARREARGHAGGRRRRRGRRSRAASGVSSAASRNAVAKPRIASRSSIRRGA